MDIERNFDIKDTTEEELIRKISKHANKKHNMKNVSPEMIEKIKNAIKSGVPLI